MSKPTGPSATKIIDEKAIVRNLFADLDDLPPVAVASHPAFEVKESSDDEKEAEQEAEQEEEVAASQEQAPDEDENIDVEAEDEEEEEEVKFSAHSSQHEEEENSASASHEASEQDEEEEEDNANSASASKEEKKEETVESFQQLGKVVAIKAKEKQEAIATKAEADNKAANAKNAADEKAAAAHATIDAAGLPADKSLDEAKVAHKDQAAEEERKRLAAEAKNRVDHSGAKVLADDAKKVADAKLPTIRVTAHAALDAQVKANDDAAKLAAEHKKIDDEKHEALGKVVKLKSDFVTPTLPEPIGKVMPLRLTKRIADAVKAIETQKTAVDPVAATILTGEKADKSVKALTALFDKSKADSKAEDALGKSVKIDLQSVKVEPGIDAAKDERSTNKASLTK